MKHTFSRVIPSYTIDSKDSLLALAYFIYDLLTAYAETDKNPSINIKIFHKTGSEMFSLISAFSEEYPSDLRIDSFTISAFSSGMDNDHCDNHVFISSNDITKGGIKFSVSSSIDVIVESMYLRIREYLHDIDTAVSKNMGDENRIKKFASACMARLALWKSSIMRAS